MNYAIIDDTPIVRSDSGDDWANKNRAGRERERAANVIEQMKVTGDITLLLGECRKMDGNPFYDGEGVGFFMCIAAALNRE